MSQLKIDEYSVEGFTIPSASLIDLENATGDLVDISGTTTITSIQLFSGHERTVRFTGILTLTHGTNLVLPGGANITTAAGDFAVFRGYVDGKVRCVVYTAAGASGAGDVTGPASATDNAAAAFDSTTGKLIKDGAAVNVLLKRAVESFTTTATAAGTTTLTVASNPIQEFTGVTTQTVTLPVVTTLPKTGFQFTIVNNSTGAVTVNSSGANLVQTVAAGTITVLTCVLLTGTTAASWDSNAGVALDSSGNVTTTGNLTVGNNIGATGVYYIGVIGGAPILDTASSTQIRWRGTDATSRVWHTNVAGRTSVMADVTNATATMANITDLSTALVAGRTYTGEMVMKCSDSTAAEGISFDFDGGTATMTAFAAGAGVLTGGTTVAVTTVSSALATDLNWTTITGETWITVKLGFTVNAAGTFIPRFCQGTAHTSGTATVSRGSFLSLVDTTTL